MKSSNANALRLLSGVATIFIFIFGAGVYFNMQLKPDSKNCVGKPQTSNVFLIDNTDAYSTQTYRAIEERILNEIGIKNVEDGNIKPNELIVIVELDETSDKNLKILFEGCKPNTPNPALITKNDKNVLINFNNRIKAAVSSSLKVKLANYSPITSTITDLMRLSFMQVPNAKLHIYSDMIEFTEKFSLYKCTNQKNPEYEYIKNIKGSFEKLKFSNTVDLNLMPSTLDSAGINCRMNFWNWFFSRQLEYNPLPGVRLATQTNNNLPRNGN